MATNRKITEAARETTGDKKKSVPKATKLRLVFEIDIGEIGWIMNMLAGQGVVVPNPPRPRQFVLTVGASASN